MKEEQDIDMEENTFLPKIENIYSNVDNIKTEIINVYEDNDYELGEDDTHSYYVPISNKIILGSKPPSNQPSNSSNEGFPASHTEEHEFHCDKCNLSFHTQNDLDSHKTASHSYLVVRPISSLKRLSTGSSSPEDSLVEMAKARQKALKSTAKSTQRHSYPIASTSTRTVKSEVSLLCNHCDVIFPNEIDFIKHTYELIPGKEYKCGKCDEDFDSTSDLHLHMVLHKKQAANKFLQCKYCTCLLMFPNSLEKHMRVQHKTKAPPPNYIPFPEKCAICLKAMPTQKQYNSHIAGCHRSLYEMSHKLNEHRSVLFQPKAETSKTIVRPPQMNAVVKRTLFKCDKCQVHFVTCASAVEHSKRCALAKGEWKCSACRRSFMLKDKEIHLFQHEHTDDFDVHTTDDNIINRVLCKCVKCELYFDEAKFWSHVAVACVSTTGVDCGSCGYTIHPRSAVKHRRNHATYGYTRQDYIPVEFLDVLPRSMEPAKTRILFYCVHCKANSYLRRFREFHTSGECKRLPTRNCPVCGLLFTLKSLRKHINDDHGENVTLNDIKFLRYHDEETMKPPVPEFVKCQKCSVRFVSNGLLKDHNCRRIKCMKCRICTQKYDQITYDMHLAFHEYRLNSSDVQEQLFYACAPCNYGFNSYDGLVEHCQNHYNNTEALATVRCKICKLNYAESHSDSHAGRYAFRILKFDYHKLLSDDWLKGFESVPQEDINEILSKSMYGALRNIRLVLATDGPPERSLYKCAICEVCIDSESIVDHAREVCVKTTRYTCVSCSAAFRTKSAKNQHDALHVVYGDEFAFREIVFNEPTDKSLNEALLTGVQKESLKVKKCQHCELLIKTDEYDTHIKVHRRKIECANPKPEVGYKLFKMGGAKKLYTVYQCRRCKACVLRKENLTRHGCNQNVQQCKKCSLWIGGFKTRHEALHKTMPKFVKSNICVIEFELEDPTTKIKHKVSYLNRGVKKSKSIISELQKELTSIPEYSIPDISNWRRNRRNCIHQCVKCYMCFTTLPMLVRHQAKCDLAETPDRCERCDLTFHPSLSSFHDSLHDLVSRGMIDRHVYLIRATIDGKDHTDESNWLYKCNACDVYYMSFRSLEFHFTRNHKSFKDFERCLVCNLTFPVKTLVRHVNIHHSYNWSLNDVNILDMEVKAIASAESEICFDDSEINTGDDAMDAMENDDDISIDSCMDESTNVNIDDNTSVKDDPAMANKSSGKNKILFKCLKCSVHYLSKGALDFHIIGRGHKSSHVKCEICGLNFGSRSIDRHKNMHHRKLKFKRRDFVINTFESMRKSDAKAQEMINSDINAPNADETVNFDDSEREQENALNVDSNVYKCIQCSIHFADKNELLEHSLVQNHSESPTADCDICGLRFDSGSLLKHKRVHHEKLKASDLFITYIFGSDAQNVKNTDAFSIDDDMPLKRPSREEEALKRPRIFKLYQCQDCRVCVERAQRRLHACCSDLQKKHCVRCSLSFRWSDFAAHRRLHRRHPGLRARHFALVRFGRRRLRPRPVPAEESTQPEITTSSGAPPGPPEPSPSARKLFRCFDCDVYFLTQGSYYAHIYKHATLDPTEYIACKMCDLQFLTAALGEHMKTHRERNFDLKNLLIQSYQPDTNELIERYYAVDQNSKLVTTTTSFDEVEAVSGVSQEQLSTVDSTSDVIVDGDEHKMA